MDKPAMKTKYENQNVLCRGLMESRHSCEPAQLCWLSWDSQENAWTGASWKPELVLQGQRGVWDVVNSEFCFLLHRQCFMHLKPMNPTEDIYNSHIRAGGWWEGAGRSSWAGGSCQVIRGKQATRRREIQCPHCRARVTAVMAELFPLALCPPNHLLDFCVKIPGLKPMRKASKQPP